ncbi:MAG: exodeoxyribonuclease VII small subunit [Gemmatimonadaceae bacterium]|jgi:exodeoxyribonuclease VII small subunit|nr:exodeoxyribonuclease VII small subunit [Gemmatimonadaceae bacterium]
MSDTGMTYEASLRRLQQIVGELEGDRLPLAEALALFEEGVGRLRDAAGALQETEARVMQLIEQADGSLSLGETRG